MACPAQRLIRPRTVLGALPATAVAALAACAGAPPASPPARPPPPAAAVEPPDASYDWQNLVRMPFGTRLNASPVRLHEVLLFHSEQPAGNLPDCYGIDGAAPRFVGQPADDYRLCFLHDRLHRIEASVRLPAADAGAVFMHACDRWLKASTPAAGNLDRCEGSDRGIGWSARLSGPGREPGALLSMILTAASDEGAEATTLP